MIMKADAAIAMPSSMVIPIAVSAVQKQARAGMNRTMMMSVQFTVRRRGDENLRAVNADTSLKTGLCGTR